MKGLLLKDFYTVIKQMKVFLILILIFAFVPSGHSSLYSFAIMYAIMLPGTALAYDERSKWNILAKMMPYSKRDIVFSKYVFGYIGCAAATVVVCIAQSIVGLIMKTPLSAGLYTSILISACVSFIMLALYLPLMFKFGSEKGRTLIIFILVFLMIGLSALGGVAAQSLAKGTVGTSFLIVGIGAVAALIINIISVEITVRLKLAD